MERSLRQPKEFAFYWLFDWTTGQRGLCELQAPHCSGRRRGELSRWLMPGRVSLASFPGPGSLLPARRRGRRRVCGATFPKGLVSSHPPAVTRASLQLLPSFLLSSRRARARVRHCLCQASGSEKVPDIVTTCGRPRQQMSQFLPAAASLRRWWFHLRTRAAGSVHHPGVALVDLWLQSDHVSVCSHSKAAAHGGRRLIIFISLQRETGFHPAVKPPKIPIPVLRCLFFIPASRGVGLIVRLESQKYGTCRKQQEESPKWRTVEFIAQEGFSALN